jgi:hypothetical protein
LSCCERDSAVRKGRINRVTEGRAKEEKREGGRINEEGKKERII